jgi:hypothetical protein
MSRGVNIAVSNAPALAAEQQLTAMATTIVHGNEITSNPAN